MKKIFSGIMTLALMMAMVAGCAHENKMEGAAELPGVIKGQVSVMTATVVDIDLQKRIVTLQNQEGDIQDFKVGDEAVDLPQVKAGDNVTIKFYESVAVEAIKPGMVPASGQNTTIIRPKPGEMPKAMVTHQLAMTATVKAINMQSSSISLMGPRGKTVKVKVEDPQNLDQLKVGDELMIVFTEAQAISVEHAR